MKTEPAVSPELVKAFVPQGRLCVSINIGNPIVANLNANGQPESISLDVANALAAALGLGTKMLVFDAAGKSVAAAHAYVADFVERCKASGFVADSMARHGIQGATVAPPDS